MALTHGINTTKSDTEFIAVEECAVGIPVFIGAAPVHTVGGYTGQPRIAYSFDEAKKLLGYSDTWRAADKSPYWSLCQAMYSHFKLFGMSPAIFINVFDPTVHIKAVASSAQAVTDHIVKLGFGTINDSDLVVVSGETTLVKGTDYEVYYTGSNLIVELLEGGSAYSAVSVNIAYNQFDVSKITSTVVNAAIEQVELCMPLFGIVPDLICAPGWSSNPLVAAVMAAKAASINGMFRAKAVVDLDSSTTGANSYDKVLNYKTSNGYTDENMIVCWPLVKVKTKLFDLSTIICGLIASVDSGNEGVPYESPSNKSIPITQCVNKADTKINLTPAQADAVSVNAGVVTAFNFNGWVAWGNYTGCYPGSDDVARYFICTNRMQDFLCNTFIKTFWNYLDQPLTRVLIDSVVDSYNSFLDGLTSENALYGGQIEYVESNNSTEDLIAGKFRLDTTAASPVPMQTIDMFVEYGVDLLTAALSATAEE